MLHPGLPFSITSPGDFLRRCIRPHFESRIANPLPFRIADCGSRICTRRAQRHVFLLRSAIRDSTFAIAHRSAIRHSRSPSDSHADRRRPTADRRASLRHGAGLVQLVVPVPVLLPRHGGGVAHAPHHDHRFSGSAASPRETPAEGPGLRQGTAACPPVAERRQTGARQPRPASFPRLASWGTAGEPVGWPRRLVRKTDKC